MTKIKGTEEQESKHLKGRLDPPVSEEKCV